MPHKSNSSKNTRSVECILVQADFGASGMWVNGRCVSDPTYIGVSEELSARFEKWIRHYERQLDDKPFDWATFSARGRKLAIELKRELPEAEIFYFDEERNKKRPEGSPAIWEDIQHLSLHPIKRVSSNY